MKNLSGLANVSEQDREIFNNALPILQRNGYTQKMINDYGRFAQILENECGGLNTG